MRSAIPPTLTLALTLACGSSGAVSPARPDPLPTPTPALALPAHLLGRWVGAGNYQDRVQPTDNVVVLRPNYESGSTEPLATWLAARHVGVIVYAGHIFDHEPGDWAHEWSAEWEAYLGPFRQAGILFGIQVLDEPLQRGIEASTRDAAIAYTQAKGYRTLVVEWVDAAKGEPRAPSTWYGVSCYNYTAVNWPAPYCAAVYAEHPEWDTVVGLTISWRANEPPMPEVWERAAAGRSLLWWSDWE